MKLTWDLLIMCNYSACKGIKGGVRRQSRRTPPLNNKTQ